MIRYVLAIVLTAALLGVAFSAVDRGARMQSDRQVESELVAIETAATSLLEDEQLPPGGEDGPRRIVEVELPAGGLLADPVATFVVSRLSGTERSVASYRVEGTARQRTVLDAPIVADDGGSLDLSGRSGTVRLVLELRQDSDGLPIVAVSEQR